MDGIDTLQSSAPETKAERIARYKAERRRELAERYGNTEEFTSKYVLRERKTAGTSETMSSATKEKEKCEDNGSEQMYTRRGFRSKVAEPAEPADDESTKRTVHPKTETTAPSKSEAVPSIKRSSHSRLLETDDTEEPKADEKPVNSDKRSAPSNMSLFKEVEGMEDGSSSRQVVDKRKPQLISRDEKEASTSPPKPDTGKVMEGKESTDKSSWKQQHEDTATTEEKSSSLHSDRALPLSKNRDASPPPSPPCQSATVLQRQDSGPQGIKGILKKSRSTSVESDHSDSVMPDRVPAQQSSVTLSHSQSEEGKEEVEEEEQEEEMEEEEEAEEVEQQKKEEEEEEEEMEGEVNGENGKDDESLTDDIPDGSCLTRYHREGSSSSGGGSFEEMRSPSPDESLEKSSTMSEDVEELESSLDGSQSSSFKQRLAELREGEDSPKKPRASQGIQTSLADRFSQLHDAENAWKKKFCVQAEKRLGCGHIYSFAESACFSELLPRGCEVRRAWSCSGFGSGDAKARDPGLS